MQLDASDVFVLRDDEDLEDVLRRVSDQRRYGCVLVNNTRMDEPAQVRREDRDSWYEWEHLVGGLGLIGWVQS